MKGDVSDRLVVGFYDGARRRPSLIPHAQAAVRGARAHPVTVRRPGAAQQLMLSARVVLMAVIDVNTSAINRRRRPDIPEPHSMVLTVGQEMGAFGTEGRARDHTLMVVELRHMRRGSYVQDVDLVLFRADHSGARVVEGHCVHLYACMRERERERELLFSLKR